MLLSMYCNPTVCKSLIIRQIIDRQRFTIMKKQQQKHKIEYHGQNANMNKFICLFVYLFILGACPYRQDIVILWDASSSFSGLGMVRIALAMIVGQ